MLGIIVAQTLRRNRKITITTNVTVTNIVNSISLTDARIVVVHITGAIIAQVLVEAVERLRQIRVATTVHDVEPLIGMGVIKPKAIFGGGGWVEFRSRRRERGSESQYQTDLIYQ